MSDLSNFLRQAANVRPSARQMAWFDTEFYAFAHFGINTFTGREWGLGDEDPQLFNPTELDCDQWVAAIKAAGMKALILTAKHHDGFCLWPSKFTEHSVKNSPFRGGKGDVVREAAEACRRGGIKFGFYLSPWDRNSALYGTEAYNDYYKAQLTELLTEYGDIFCVWFDNACGEGPNGRRQVYDFPGYIDLVRKYQPDAVIFNDYGPDTRWCGNESGTARHAEWAVVPGELCHLAQVQTGPGPLTGDLSYMYNTDESIGDLGNILYSRGLCFCGAEVDMSIRPGWFYHPEEEPHSLERLMRTYMTSVGGNACFHLNVPPMPNGRLDERDVRRLRELGEALENAFGGDLSADAAITRCDAARGDTQCSYELAFPEARPIRYAILAEDIAGRGQRIEHFLIQAADADEVWRTVAQGTTVGHKRIVDLRTPSGAPVNTRRLRVRITAARDRVEGLSIRLS